MPSVLVSGYSTKLLKFDLDQDLKLALNSSQEIDSNPTFAAVDTATNSYYAVHEVKSFEGKENTGGLTRWSLNNGQDAKKTQVRMTHTKDVQTLKH